MVHGPTGTNVSTFRFTNRQTLPSKRVNFGAADDDYDQVEIIGVWPVSCCARGNRSYR